MHAFDILSIGISIFLFLAGIIMLIVSLKARGIVKDCNNLPSMRCPEIHCPNDGSTNPCKGSAFSGTLSGDKAKIFCSNDRFVSLADREKKK